MDAATLAIATAWNTAWTGLYGSPPSVPYVLDNEQFAEPNPSTSWVRLAIRHQTGTKLTLGAPARYKRTGSIFVQVFAPVDQGRNPLDILSRQVMDALEAQNFGSFPGDCVTTYGANPREAPTGGQWSQITISIPFDYFESK